MHYLVTPHRNPTPNTISDLSNLTPNPNPNRRGEGTIIVLGDVSGKGRGNVRSVSCAVILLSAPTRGAGIHSLRPCDSSTGRWAAVALTDPDNRVPGSTADVLRPTQMERISPPPNVGHLLLGPLSPPRGRNFIIVIIEWLLRWRILPFLRQRSMHVGRSCA